VEIFSFEGGKGFLNQNEGALLISAMGREKDEPLSQISNGGERRNLRGS